MIEKTPILRERRVVRMSENTDLRVRQNKAANQIVLQISFDCESKRFFCQAPPCFTRDVVAIESAFEFCFCDQRLQHCIPGLLGKDPRQMIKFSHLLKLGGTSG